MTIQNETLPSIDYDPAELIIDCYYGKHLPTENSHKIGSLYDFDNKFYKEGAYLIPTDPLVFEIFYNRLIPGDGTVFFSTVKYPILRDMNFSSYIEVTITYIMDSGEIIQYRDITDLESNDKTNKLIPQTGTFDSGKLRNEVEAKGMDVIAGNVSQSEDNVFIKFEELDRFTELVLRLSGNYLLEKSLSLEAYVDTEDNAFYIDVLFGNLSILCYFPTYDEMQKFIAEIKGKNNPKVFIKNN